MTSATILLLSLACAVWFLSVLVAVFGGAMVGIAVYKIGQMDERKVWEGQRQAEDLADYGETRQKAPMTFFNMN